MKRILGLVTVLAALALGMNAVASPFGAGDIVVFRVANGSETLTNIGNTVWLDEYTPAQIAAGCFFCAAPVPVQSIMMPTNWVGGEGPLIASGQGIEEGLMSLSKDGRYLVLPGFAATIGQLTNLTTYAFPSVSSNADVAGSDTTNAVTEADVPRVVGLVDAFGHIYTSTTITNVAEQGADISSTVSDGTNFWVAGGDKIVSYVIPGTMLATQVCGNTQLDPARAIGIYGKTLYVDKNVLFGGAMNTYSGTTTNISGTSTNIYTLNPFGGAMPVVSSNGNFGIFPTVSPVSGEAFVMFNLANANPAGVDTLYLADENATGIPGEPSPRGGGVLKYCYMSGSWSNLGVISGEDAFGVTGVEVSSTNITLYITEETNTTLYSFTDISGYGNPPINNDGTFGSDSLIMEPVAGFANTLIRGIAIVPSNTNGVSSTGTLSAGGGVISVGPPYGPYFRGPQGGPFTPSNAVTYSVANLGSAPTNFTVQLTGFTGGVGNWVTASPASGTLAAGQSVNVNVSYNANATNLPGGQAYTGTILFHTGPNGGTKVAQPVATIVVDALYLKPTTNFVSLEEAPGNGTFVPPSTVYVLSNATPGPLNFTAFTSNDWTSLSCNLMSVSQIAGNVLSGSVPGLATANITVSINANADSLSYGTYDDLLVLTNVNTNLQLPTTPSVYLQVGFGFFDDFNAGTYTPGNVVGQNAWMANSASLTSTPVPIETIVGGTNCVGCLGGSNEYVVAGGCPNATSTAQQPYKYVAFGPVTNAFNVVGGVSNNVPTYAIAGVLITFTNAPSDPNYVFSLHNEFHDWNDAGIIQNGGGYSWTTELNSDETGGGPEGTPLGVNVYSFYQQYQVYFVSDFVGSNSWVFVSPGTNDLGYLLANSPSNLNPSGSGLTNNNWLAVWSDGLSDCSYCAGLNPQGWESVTLGQYSGSGNNCDPIQPGYFITKVAASTNYVAVYNFLNGISSSSSSDPFTTWQDYYFTGPELSNPSYSGPNASPVGTGYSNTNQFLLGFNPTNSAAYLHIISVVRTNGNAVITYLGANGDTSYASGPVTGFTSRTNVLEFTTGTANGSFSSINWTSTGQTNILSGGDGLGVVTNMVDVGGATNKPSRYYRIQVILP